MRACMHATGPVCRCRCCKSYPVPQWGSFRDSDFFLDGGLGSLGKASEGFPKTWGCQNGFMGQPVGVQLMLTCFQGCLSLGMVRLGFTQEKKKKKKGLKGSSRSHSSPSTREVLALWKPQCWIRKGPPGNKILSHLPAETTTIMVWETSFSRRDGWDIK